MYNTYNKRPKAMQSFREASLARPTLIFWKAAKSSERITKAKSFKCVEQFTLVVSTENKKSSQGIGSLASISMTRRASGLAASFAYSMSDP